MRSIFLALFLLFALCALPAHAGNGLNRCIAVDGTSIFTDQKCEDIGAMQRVDPPPLPGNLGNGFRLHANACARKPDDLLHGLENAIRAADVNQVAAFYHWPGVSAEEAVAILNRLQELVGRPLLSIELLYAHRSQDETSGAGPSTGTGTGISARASVDDVQDEAVARKAYAVQIVQNRSQRDGTPIRSTLSLRRNIDCWWVQF
jgi:hypothetical protein